jgi:hypothetical protein
MSVCPQGTTRLQINEFSWKLVFGEMNEKCLDRSCRENQNTHFICNNFFAKLVLLSDDMENYGRAGRGHRWQYNK